jgi:glycosyltransferase involved in cell wall biosynthesis
MTPTRKMSPPRKAYSDLDIAVLTEMGSWNASTRYRALQHVPRLRTYFRSVDVSTAQGAVPRRPRRAGQALYFATHAKRYAERARSLPETVAGHDALLVQRGLYRLGPALIVSALNGYRGRLVLDLDDAVFEPRPSMAFRGRLAKWMYGPQQTLALLRRADAVVVSTAALAEMLPRWAPHPVVLPTVPDPARYRTVSRRDDRVPPTVGWTGNAGNLLYLDRLRPVFERLARDGVARLEVVCSRPWRDPASFRRWRLEDEATLFEDFSIGIMPLPDTPYTRAKAGFKLLQYMAAGLPVVASPVGINRELVERSGAGWLAESTGQWEDALRELAADPARRSELGARGREFVERYADLDAQARTLAELLAGVHAG